MLEFIASLKYYARTWPRASLFSKLVNVLGVARVPGTFSDSVLNNFDSHTQDFFFRTFELVKTKLGKSENFSEIKTNIEKNTVLELIEHIFFFMDKDGTIRVKDRLRRSYISYLKDGEAVEGVDLDLFFSISVDFFLEQRGVNLKKLRRYFSKYYTDEKGNILFFKKVLKKKLFL